ncbi:MAG: hypothetical protein DI598_15260 [Pseudopedobacter saltans]|uniref:Integrase catalytic domain-containing protein n=1 Tax=Pseudopedobacter saltans TaxID=151895 RepID=A0A2W5GDY3_9SPHI|nr:MAG: hypothetical protein DI598_15260 [Pseudopedobacter saltans]
MPFVPLKAPECKNQQWQIDGFEIPFWVDGDKLFERWVLVRIMDSCTRKILSSTVAKTETSVVILETLQKAIIQEQCVPSELIMDKHSGAGTDGFKVFKTEIEKLGCMVEITTDPTKKAYIEKYNQYLNKYFSQYPEWQGEGRAGKNPRRRSEEKINELRKRSNMISRDEVIARGLFACHEFNKSILAPIGNISPLDKDATTASKGISITSHDQLVRMFTCPKEMKITRGMIIMKQGIQKVYYTLSQDNILQYNNTRVAVHYESFGGSIYLFSQDGQFIESSEAIEHGSTSRTERKEQKQPMAKVPLNKQFKEKTENELEGLMKNPESIEFIPSYLINKSAYAEIQQSLELKRLSKIEGLHIAEKMEQIVHVPGERHNRKHYSPEMEDNEVADLGGLADLMPRKNKSSNDKTQQ